MLDSSFVDVETWTVSNGLKFNLQGLPKVLNVFNQVDLLEEDEIWMDFLDLCVVEEFVDDREPWLFYKKVGLVIEGSDG